MEEGAEALRQEAACFIVGGASRWGNPWKGRPRHTGPWRLPPGHVRPCWLPSLSISAESALTQAKQDNEAG